MNRDDVGRLWNENADGWTAMARDGADVCRDFVNTPAFLRMLPEVDGLGGLDVGCGEGHNTRLVARRGARMTGIDIAERFIRHARAAEADDPLGIDYRVAPGSETPFPDAHFDFAMATMSLMDMPDQEAVMTELHRVLKPGGFFQFSITHPCFNGNYRKWIRDDTGNKLGLMVWDYFANRRGDIDEFTFGNASEEHRKRFPKFKVPRFDRTMSGWINLAANAGFRIEAADEPVPSPEALEVHPEEADHFQAPLFLILRVRK